MVLWFVGCWRVADSTSIPAVSGALAGENHGISGCGQLSAGWPTGLLAQAGGRRLVLLLQTNGGAANSGVVTRCHLERMPRGDRVVDLAQLLYPVTSKPTGGHSNDFHRPARQHSVTIIPHFNMGSPLQRRNYGAGLQLFDITWLQRAE